MIKNLIVGFGGSNDEYKDFIIEQNYIGIDPDLTQFFKNNPESIKFKTNGQIIEDSIDNIKDYYSEPTFSTVFSSRCIGRMANNISDLIDVIVPGGRIKIYEADEENIETIISQAKCSFNEITISISYCNDEVIQYSINLIDKCNLGKK